LGPTACVNSIDARRAAARRVSANGIGIAPARAPYAVIATS
jgi:hypothetical protein